MPTRRALIYLRVYARMLLLILLGRPYKLSLLVTDGCNLRCRICSLWKTRDASWLTLEEVRRIWDAFPWKPCWINVSGGEPTLSRELEGMLTFFAGLRRPLLVTLTTNGFIDCSTMVQRVLAGSRSAVVYVSVSIDGDADTHDEARGRTGSHDHAWATYLRLRELGRRFPMLEVGVSTTLSLTNLAGFLPFFRRLLAECPAVSINLPQFSSYYRNEPGDAFQALPAPRLREVVREIQALLPKRSLDSFLKVSMLEMVIEHLERRYRPVPCTSYRHNVLVSADPSLVDCTLRFRPWGEPFPDRRDRVDAIVDAIRAPRTRLRVLRAEIAKAGCEQSCHTPCEKYVHIIGALVNPFHAPRLLLRFVQVCLRATRISAGAPPAESSARTARSASGR